MILLLLIPLALFPDNSTDGVAYLVGAGGAEIGAQVMDLFIADDVPFVGREILKITGGLVASALFHVALRNHFSTESENGWVATGRGHWMLLRVSFDLIKLKLD